MSCIGRYRRNMIDYKKAKTWSLCSYSILIMDVLLVLVYAKFDLDPKIVFYIDSIAMILAVEMFYTCILFSLTMEKVPVEKCPPRTNKFYVRPPGPLSPRRQYLPPKRIQPQPLPAILPGRFSHPSFKTVQRRRRTGFQNAVNCSQKQSFGIEVFSIEYD